MSKECPFISIILLCYNYGHIIQKMLDSIAKQTFKDYELIIVNNGSTDNTDEVSKQFIDGHPEISVKYVKIEKNEGIAKGDNTGVSHSSGKYLMFADADDWMDDCCLENLSKVAKTTDADRIIGSIRYVDQNGKVIGNKIAGYYPSRWSYAMQQSNLFRRSIYVDNDVQLLDYLWIDAEKTMKFSSISKTVAFSKDVDYNYYVHVSTSNNTKVAEGTLNDDGRYSFKSFANYLKTEVYDNTEGVEKDTCLAQIVKLYYSYLLICIRNVPYKMAKTVHKKMSKDMKELFPNYQKIRVFSKSNPVKFIRKLYLKFFIVTEKTRLIYPVMWVYILYSKRKYMIV